MPSATHLLILLAAMSLSAPWSMAGVRLNEMSAATSSRLLSFGDDRTARVGTTLPWQAAGYEDSAWASATGRISWDDTPGLREAMRNVTPSVYLRHAFHVSPAQAASSAQLELTVRFQAGYIAYLNGVEIARRHLGPPKAFAAHDQLAYQDKEDEQTTLLGPASTFLTEGENILAFQLHSHDLRNGPTIDPRLTIIGSDPLVTAENLWRYLPGITEPSGGVYDRLAPKVDHADWIELHNDSAESVDLSGWSLSDDIANPIKWTFPSGTQLPGQGYLIVMADGSDLAGEELHTNFSLAAKGEDLILTDPTGQIIDQWTNYPEQDYFHTYGRQDGVLTYLSQGTPGGANESPALGSRVARPNADLDGGFYDDTITVSLTTTTPGARIRYTIDGSDPTARNGHDYTGSLTFGESVTLRSRALLDAHISSEVTTNTYLLYPSGSPLAMLRDLPAITITGDDWRTIGQDNGIAASSADDPAWGNYSVREQRGRFTERQAYVEFHFAGTPQASLKTGLGIRYAGSTHSRSNADLSQLAASPWIMEWNTRPSMNLFFRDEYGKASLSTADLVPHSLYKKHNSLRLRAGKNDLDVFTKDEIVRRTMRDMGHVSAVGNLANLWVHGKYKGLMNLTERYTEEFFQTAVDDQVEWDIIASGGLVEEGDDVAWAAMRAFYATHDLAIVEHYATFSEMLDIDAYIDYILLMSYTLNNDWPTNNWFFARPRAEGGKFFPLVWDAEATFRAHNNAPETHDLYASSSLNPSQTGGANPIGEIFKALTSSDEFKLRFADRMAKHLFHDGALTEPQWRQRQDNLRPLVAPVWAYLKGRQYDDGDLYEWFTLRQQGMLSSAEVAGFWSETDPSIMPLPPEFNQHGGVIGSEFELRVTQANAEANIAIYVTFDGSDPRVLGGAVAPSAQLVDGPITLEGYSGLVSARTYMEGRWSPIQQAIFVSEEPPPLRITELMYHPAAASPEEIAEGFLDAEAFEYIELMHLGSASLDLSGFQFVNGVLFDFTDATTTSLAPGQHVVLVKDPEAFRSRYGSDAPIIGTYTGALKNSGEQITLIGPGEIPILDFAFDDAWQPSTDGLGFALEIVDAAASASTWSDPTSWRPSAALGGSPGTEGSDQHELPELGAVVIHEILTHTDTEEGDWIELHNTTNAPIPIGGWFLSDNSATPLKYRIHPTTVIPADGYLVFTSRDHFGSGSSDSGALVPFGLSEHGETVILSSAHDDELTGYQEAESFGGADNAISLGRHALSDGTTVFTTLASPTPGEANSAPKVGQVVLSKIHYNPDFGDEYLELTNRSETTVALFDPSHPSHTWQFTNGIDYILPPYIELSAGQRVVIVPFDPINTTALSNFTERYHIPPGVAVVGPYTGSLSNAGERVTLSRPGTPDSLAPHAVPMIIEDSVRYDDTSPWPAIADGFGSALERRALDYFGDDPASWRAADSAGPPLSPFEQWLQDQVDANSLADIYRTDQWLPAADPDEDGLSLLIEYFMGLDPMNSTESGMAISVDGERTRIRYRKAPGVGGNLTTIYRSRDAMASWQPVAFTTAFERLEEDHEIWIADVVEGSYDYVSLFFRLEISLTP